MLGKNLVSDVSYREDTILIRYNEVMTMDITEENSYLNKDNYYLEINGIKQYLDLKDKVERVGRTSAKIILIDKSINRLTKLHFGYSTAKEIKFIMSKDGNIHNCAYSSILGEEVEAFNLFTGSKVIVIDSYTLRVIYNGRNRLGIGSEIDNILSYFSVIIPNSEYAINPVNPISLEYEGYGSYTFKFKEPIFESYSGFNGVLYVASNSKCKDIYGKNIDGDINVNIISNPSAAILERFKLTSNNENGVVGFILTFSKDIKVFNYNDFEIDYNGLKYKVGLTRILDERTWVIYSYIPRFIQEDRNKVSIYTRLSADEIGTRDINMNKIVSTPVEAEAFGASTVRWNHNNTLNNSKVWVCYEDSVKISSIVSNNYDDLDLEYTINISGDDVDITGGIDNLDLVLDFKSINYGKIVFKHKIGQGNILASSNIGLGDIKLKYHNKFHRLDIVFSQNNTMDISIDAISSIEYESNKNIQNIRDVFITTNKKVSQLVSRVIETSGDINPFECGNVLNGNTIININQRIVGLPLIYGSKSEVEVAIINGDITINIDKLSTSIEVILHNLIIDGDIVIENLNNKQDIINLDNINGRGTIYIKGDINCVASNIEGLNIEIII